MKTKIEMETPADLGAGVDLWPACSLAAPARADSSDPLEAPRGWHKLALRSRRAIVAAAMDAMREHPEKNKPSDISWVAHRVRERLTSDGKVMTDLWQPELLAHELLSSVARKLAGRGALLERLKVQQAELTRAIALLERPAR